MRENGFLIVLFSILGLLVSCSAGKHRDILDAEVVKVVKTRAYTAKAHFDELTFDEPVYQFVGYQELLGDIDCSHVWTIQYFDQHNNILKVERVRLDDNEEEKIEMTTIYEYYSLEKGLLSSVKNESNLVGQFGEKYIRNENGDLLEIIRQHNDETKEKTKYLYNSTNQLIKEEIYKENGIAESIEYTYDSPLTVVGRLIRKEKVSGEDYRRETDYELSDEGLVVSKRSKIYQDGGLFSDITTIYEDYIGDVATKEIRKGSSKPTLISVDAYGRKVDEHGGGDVETIIIKELDARGNIIKQIEKESGGSELNNFDIKYTYNDNGDWIKLLIKTNYGQYIFVRDIEYVN